MAFTGTQLVAGRIPGERIATSIETTDSATFTAETQVMSITVPLVTGRTYRVRVIAGFISTSSEDQVIVRIREDNTSGTVLNRDYVFIATGTTNRNFKAVIEAEFTAASTANKTFVITGERAVGGAGDCMLETAEAPAYLYVDYIRG